MTLVAAFAAGTGVLLLAWWGLALAGGDLPDRDTRPKELATHLLAEVLTAVSLIAAAIGLAVEPDAAEARIGAAAALGALLYTLLQTPGDFRARGQRGLAAAYAVALALDVAAITTLLTQ